VTNLYGPDSGYHYRNGCRLLIADKYFGFLAAAMVMGVIVIEDSGMMAPFFYKSRGLFSGLRSVFMIWV
jgi:hypothetical protein